MTTSVILPRADHERATRSAYALRWTLGELMRTALTDWLARNEAKGVSR